MRSSLLFLVWKKDLIVYRFLMAHILYLEYPRLLILNESVLDVSIVS